MSASMVEIENPNTQRLGSEDIVLDNLSLAPIQEEETRDEYPHGLRLVAIIIGLILSLLLCAVDSSIIATLIPAITTHFGSLNQVGWYGSAYPLLQASFTTFWGKAYTYFPLKKVFVTAVAIFQLGNVLCGSAPASSVLILGRAVSGVGSAGVFAGCFIIIAYTARPEKRPMFMTILGVTFSIASIIGPVLGGAFVDGASWRWGFWFNLPTGVVAVSILLMSFRPPAMADPQGASLKEKILHLDIPGTATVFAASTCFIQAMHYVGTAEGFANRAAIGFFVAFVLLIIAFIMIERRMSDYAMLKLQFLGRRRFAENSLFIFFFAGLFFPLMYALPIQFQSIDDENASRAGLRLIPLVLGVSIFTMVSNYLLQRYHQNTPLLVAGATIGGLGGVLIATLHKMDGVVSWTAFEVVVAIGVGAALQLPMLANQASVSASEIPTATTMTLFFETIGQAFFTAAGEAALTNTLAKRVESLPGISASAVLAAGATGFRKVFTAQEIPEIVSSYVVALGANYALIAACGSVAALISFSMTLPTLKLKFWAVRNN